MHTIISVVSMSYDTCIIDEVLNGGKVRVDVQYGVLHYATDEYDLCSKFKLKCPLNKGIQHGLFEGQVPFPNVIHHV